MKNKTCHGCGLSNPMENRFCAKCGLPFNNMVPGGEKAKPAKKSFLLPIIGMLVILALILVLILIMWQPQEAPQQTEPETSQTVCTHVWLSATCTAPMTCEICGEESGTVVDHQWVDATYSAPMTCSVCQKTAGGPLENPLAELIKERLPIITYAISTSEKIYGYDDAELTSKETSLYLDPDMGQIVITGISEDGSALEVNFPTNATLSGYSVLWFRFDDIIPLEKVEIVDHVPSNIVDTYRLSPDGSYLIDYGGTASGVPFFFIGTHKTGYYVIVYSISAQKLFGLSVEEKIAFVKIRP